MKKRKLKEHVQDVMDGHSDDRLGATDVCMRWLFTKEKWDGLKATSLEIREQCGKQSELGVFAKKEFGAGETVVDVPHEKILRCPPLPDSIESEISRLSDSDPKFKKIAEHDTAVNFMLWVALAQAKADRNSPFHAYATSLPSKSPDLVSNLERYSSDEAFTKTNAYTSAYNLKQDLAYFYNNLLSTSTDCSCTFEELLWARGMCVSRSFPAHLVDPNCWEKEPCLLPFVDLLNHKQGAKIKLCSTSRSDGSSGLAFITKEPIAAGQEIFNNYGDDKSNETLLWSYGFCLPNNPTDTFTFSLGVLRQDIHSAELTSELLKIIGIPSAIKAEEESPGGVRLSVGPLHLTQRKGPTTAQEEGVVPNGGGPKSNGGPEATAAAGRKGGKEGEGRPEAAGGGGGGERGGGVPQSWLLMMALLAAEEEDLPPPEEFGGPGFEAEVAAEDVHDLARLLRAKLDGLVGRGGGGGGGKEEEEQRRGEGEEEEEEEGGAEGKGGEGAAQRGRVAEGDHVGHYKRGLVAILKDALCQLQEMLPGARDG